MKKMILVIAALALSFAAHAEEVNPLAGTYSECVQWTTFNGIPTSKKFEAVYGEDRSILYRIGFYNYTDKCEGEAVNEVEYADFEVVKSFGRSLHFLELKEKTENLYFQLMISKEDMSLIVSGSYPVQIKPTNFIVLKRQL